ncbi:unnamed protein product [Urochloa humidicola]
MRELARRDEEERRRVAQGSRRESQADGALVPHALPAGQGAQRELPEDERQRDVHRWVMDPRRRQDMEPPRPVRDPDLQGGVRSVVRESVGTTQWPMLTKDNYIEWSSVMKVKLRVRQLWDAVDTGDVDAHEDQRALEALLAAVPMDMAANLSAKGSAKAAWDAIAAARVGTGRARKSTLQKLRQEWDRLAFKPGEDVNDFALRLSSLKERMERYDDDEISQEKTVAKFLRCVPKKYSQLRIAIETMLDISTLPLEEVAGRFKSLQIEEEMESGGPVDIGGKLHYTAEQWHASQKEQKRGESSSSSRGRKRGPRKECPQPRRGQAHVAHAAVEDEPALFLAHGSIELLPAASAATALLHVDEPRARVFLGADTSDDDKIDGWFLDSGATHHMTGRREFFSDLDTDVRGSVKFGDSSAVEIKGVGSVTLLAKTGEHRLLTGVFYIPALRNSIISLGQLDENGSRVEIADGVLRIWDCRQRLLAKVARGSNRLYILHAEVAQPLCLAARCDDEAWRWHERYGHLHFEALRRLGTKEMVRGTPCVDHVEQLCDTCVMTKQKRLPFPRQASFRAKERLELVHGDLCGPVTPATPGGRRYFLLLVDDVSRYMWAVILDSKAAAADAIKRIQASAEMECGRKLRVLRTDNGGEFTAAEFASYCADEGVHRHFTTPYTPQQNGVVERRNQTVVAMARALLKQRGTPAIFWAEAVMTAVHILNRSPTKALDGMTPYEAWHGRKPAVGHFRVFGCLVYVKELNHVGKLDDRSTPGVFIGYPEGVKGYRVLDPVTQRVRVARDVVFDEGRCWPWDKMADADSTSTYGDFTVDYVDFAGTGGVGSSPSTSVPHPVPRSSSSSSSTTPSLPPTPAAAATTTPAATSSATPAASSSVPPPAPAGTPAAASPTPPPSPSLPHSPAPMGTPPGAAATPAHDEHSPVEFATPLSDDEDRVDAYHDGEPLRYRTVADILGDQPVPGLVPHDLEGELYLTYDDGEPRSFAEAERHAAWRAAMKTEMDAVEKNRTWELADLPPGHRAISLKWVYKLKKDEAGAVIKYKARLVARGFVQQEGVDFDDAFAPVARMESVRLLLALAAQEGWRVHHMDVKSAFLNGDLKEEVYVQQPSGFVIPGMEGKVCRLRKALYGLRQAPRAWNTKLDATLRKMGFEQSPHDAAVYRRGRGGSSLLVGVYVDDLIITGSSDAEVEAFKREMKAAFQMSDLGPLSFYLGIEVHQDDTGITLRQTAYAKRVVEMAGLAECNSAHTPMEERLKLSRDSTAEEVDATHYRRLVGSLRYLAHTRPDLAFSVGYVSRFMQRPTTEHLQAVKTILRYVAGTLDYGLHYPRCPGAAHFIGYSDSDHAGDIDNSKSTSGMLFFLGKCLVSWQSVKQQVVALSSCEAEYIATSSASTQGLWLARLLGDLLGREAEAVDLRVDSKSALALAKNPVFHERSKHIRVRYHFIRDCLEEGSVKATYISTKDQLADFLTKSLGRIKFQELRSRIGMVELAPKTHKT